MYTNALRLLNLESEAIHHFNVCGVYINYCYYINYTNYSNILIVTMKAMCVLKKQQCVQ
jgi:hypothetical protein